MGAPLEIYWNLYSPAGVYTLYAFTIWEMSGPYFNSKAKYTYLFYIYIHCYFYLYRTYKKCNLYF